MSFDHILGNASDEVKCKLGIPAKAYGRIRVGPPIFGDSIVKRMTVTEISIEKKAEEPQKSESRVVCEITVEDDMVNGAETMHGGCAAYLIDVCSSLALSVYDLTVAGAKVSVSQSLNVVYHSPAALGDRLRIVSTSMTIGSRASSARTEIWNSTHHRLVSSGVHIKMQPSPPKANL